jgi:predicted nucleic acid-binding protein
MPNWTCSSSFINTKFNSITSPLLYLHQIGVLEWLSHLFGEVWVPGAVVRELEEGGRKGCDVPDLSEYDWIKFAEPRATPSEWLALDLGPGELAAMALALENPERVVLLDDDLARRVAKAAGLTVRGTLGILMMAKSQELTERIEPLVGQLVDTGMWLSVDIQERILILAGEK